MLAIVTVIGAVALGAVAEIAVQARSRAAGSARNDTEPLLARAVSLYGSLSDANATATTTFLVGGLEPPARRARYLADVSSATDSLAALTRAVGGSGAAGDAVAGVTRQLPIYTGLVEAARANNRQNVPIGAAYLRRASQLMTGTILPAAGALYTIEAKRLRDDYSTGTSTAWLVAFGAAIGLLIVLMLWLQWYLARISHRILNVRMVVATVLLAALGVWGLIGLTGQQNALARARRDGSDPVEVLSAGRILVSRAQSDQSLTLIARGGDTADPADYAAVIAALGSPQGSGGLVREIHVLAVRTGSTDADAAFSTALGAYLAQQREVNAMVEQGLTSQASQLAAGPARGSGESPADRVNQALVAQVGAAQRRFGQAAADATSSLNGLALATVVVIAVAALLTLFGLRQRQLEYR